MAKSRNQLAQPLQLDGDWQAAPASISFPSNINNVNSAEIVVYVSSGAELDASHTRTGQLRRIRQGIYIYIYITVQKSFWKKFFESLN